MTPNQAEKIVKEFGDILSNKKSIYEDVRQLPHSPAMIKYAFFVYVQSLVKDNLLNEDIFDNLKTTYAAIDIHFVENPDKANRNYSDLKSGSIEDKIEAFNLISPLEKSTEFHNFVVDCEGGWKSLKTS